MAGFDYSFLLAINQFDCETSLKERWFPMIGVNSYRIDNIRKCYSVILDIVQNTSVSFMEDFCLTIATSI